MGSLSVRFHNSAFLCLNLIAGSSGIFVKTKGPLGSLKPSLEAGGVLISCSYNTGGVKSATSSHWSVTHAAPGSQELGARAGAVFHRRLYWPWGTQLRDNKLSSIGFPFCYQQTKQIRCQGDREGWHTHTDEVTESIFSPNYHDFFFLAESVSWPPFHTDTFIICSSISWNRFGFLFQL